MQITPNYQAYLDSALRDAIQNAGRIYDIDRTPIPAELRKIIIRYFNQDDNEFATDALLAECASNIWHDVKRIFREVLLRQNMRPDDIPELRVENLPPPSPVGQYTIAQSQENCTITVTCTDLGLAGSGQGLEEAAKSLHEAIHHQYIDEYRPELDQRNWGKPTPATSDQEAVLRNAINIL